MPVRARMSLIFFGIIILLLTWASPLPTLAHHRFYAHMSMHMLVVGIAAPLLSIGLSGSKFDPTPNYPLAFAPIPASIFELIIVWGWHAPGPHHFARQEVFGLLAEQSMFLLSGIWVWLSSFSPKKQGAGIIALLLTSMHMTFLGALLGLSTRPLYPHHMGFGQLTALEDQHLGGAIMLVVGGISYLSGGLWLTYTMLSSISSKKGSPRQKKILEGP